MELEGDGRGGARLAVARVVPGGGDPSAARAAAEEECGAWAARIEEEASAPREMRREVPAEAVETDRAAWERAVEETLEAIRGGRIEKAVLARTLDVTPEEPIDPVDVALALWSQNRGVHAFLFEPEPGRAVVGGAPEAVAILRGEEFGATAVAGSIRSGENPEEREELARRLLGSPKDRAEQRVVVEDVVRRLRPLADRVEVADAPHVLALARIQHLETAIRAGISGRHVLELVEALHPTPAVCGFPRDAAMAFLAEEEPFDRGWYAGPVGWFERDGDGVFVPALRTAVMADGRWRLFAGAGIVAGSDPAAEWEETGIKFEPVLRALESAGVAIATGGRR